MKKMTLAAMITFAAMATAAYAAAPKDGTQADPLLIETGIASGDLCMLPGKGASSEGAFETYNGHKLRCVRTTRARFDGSMERGQVAWVEVAEMSR